jgi:hypothetical protein
MRSLDPISALGFILENPFSERGYDLLRDFYRSCAMSEEEDAVAFLIKERFYADGPDAGEGQREDDKKSD